MPIPVNIVAGNGTPGALVYWLNPTTLGNVTLGTGLTLSATGVLSASSGGGGGSPGGSTTQVQFNNAGAFAGDANFTYTTSVGGGLLLKNIFTQTVTARTSGVTPYFIINAPADTGLTASTEAIGINVVGSIRTWADGTVAAQREYLFQAPTYNKTITTAVFTQSGTLVISGAPISGTGVTQTNPYALWVQNGNAHIGPQIGGSTLAGEGAQGLELDYSDNGNGGVALFLTNINSGTNAFTAVNMSNDLANDDTFSHFAGMFYTSSGYTYTGFGTAFAVKNQLQLYGTDGPTLIGTLATGVNGYLNVVIGGATITNEIARFTTIGMSIGAQATPTALLTIDAENLGATIATTAQGIILQNLTAATSSVTQNSPALSFSSNGWGTTAPSSQNVTFRITSTPVQGTIPSSNLIIGVSVAGGAFVTRFALTSNGGLSGLNNISINSASATMTVVRTAIANTSTDGSIIMNNTAALVGTQAQWSPRLRFTGTAWNTVGAVSETDDFIIENQTVAGNPTTAMLVISSQINAGGYTARLTLTNVGILTLSAVNSAAGSVVTADGTQTLSNKRITKRVNTITSSATPTPAGDTTDEFTVTALAAGATFAAPTGTPTDGQSLIIRIKDNGSAQTLAWNGIYRFSSDLAAPSTTVISKTFYLGFIYNAADSKWDNVSQINNF